jgi:hypothetical protein
MGIIRKMILITETMIAKNKIAELAIGSHL